MASKHLSSSKERKRKAEKQGAIENEGRESDDDEEQLRQHLERLAKVTGKSNRVSGKDKEKKKQVALLLRQYLEIIENEGSNEDEDEAPAAAGDEERVGSTVVVDTDGRPSPPMSKSDPKCFADAEKGGFEIGEDDDDDDDDDYEEEEDLSASTDEDAAASSDNGSDKLSTEELLEDVEKEAEDKLSERFLDYDKVWEYAMATVRCAFASASISFSSHFVCTLDLMRKQTSSFA